MKFLRDIAKAIGFGSSQTRSYSSAKVGRLTSDWTTAVTSANKEIRDSVKVLRARSRQLERDSDFVRRYFALLLNNTLGSNGITFQAKARDLNGNPDQVANRKIEQAWKDWSRPENCTVAGTQSFLDVQRTVLRSVARDGACLIRFVRNWKNGYRFAIQVMEIDHLDVDFNDKNQQSGNVIRMGVERDKYERPVAYWLLNGHEGDDHGLNYPTKRERIPASECLLVQQTERPHQAVGVPWLCSSMLRLNMLNSYFEASLTAARVSACTMGFFTKTDSGESYQGEEDEATGHNIMTASPGSFEELPSGMSVEKFDPSNPDASNFSEFTKSCLRSISAGLGVSYNSLANDLEGVNYSSIRAGLLEEREAWKSTQTWFIEHFLEPVFREWLAYALLSDALQLPATKETKFRSIEWKPRRWAWVDPLKDSQANVLQVENGLKSRRSIVSEAGGDYEVTLEEIAQDQELAAQKGVNFDGNPPQDPNS